MQTKLGFKGKCSFKKPTSAPNPQASFQHTTVITTVMGCTAMMGRTPLFGGNGWVEGSLTALQGGLSLERSWGAVGAHIGLGGPHSTAGILSSDKGLFP